MRSTGPWGRTAAAFAAWLWCAAGSGANASAQEGEGAPEGPGEVAAPEVSPAPQESDAREEATRLTLMGKRAWEKNKHALALSYFRLAYQVFPSPKFHYNMGLAHSGLQQYLEAVREFEAFLREAPDAPTPTRLYARARIAELERQLGWIAVTSEQSDVNVFLDGVRAPLREPVRVSPGFHTVIVTREGYRPSVVDVTVEAGKTIKQRVDLEPVALAAPAELGEVTPEIVAAPAEEAKRKRPPSLARRWWFWGAVGTVAASTVAAFYLSSREELNCPTSELGCLVLER